MSEHPTSQWITRERHLQSVLLTLVVVGLGLVGNTVGKINDNQAEQSREIVSISEKQQALSDRMDFLAADRYTGTQAAQDKLQMVERISEMSSDLRDARSRLRALEQEVARMNVIQERGQN